MIFLRSSRALSQGRMEANRALLILDLEEANLAAMLKAEAALEVPPPPIVALLMEQAKLTQEEAYRLFFVEVARWNYRIHVITHLENLAPTERAIFDSAVRLRMTSAVSRLMYENHFKANAHPDVIRYLERTLN